MELNEIVNLEKIKEFMEKFEFDNCTISLTNGTDIHYAIILEIREDFIIVESTQGIHFVFKKHIAQIIPKKSSKSRVISKPHGF